MFLENFFGSVMLEERVRLAEFPSTLQVYTSFWWSRQKLGSQQMDTLADMIQAALMLRIASHTRRF